MKFIHIVTIEQLPDGSTLVEQETKKHGDGIPSAQMMAAMKAYYDAFGTFFAGREPVHKASLTAEWGLVKVNEVNDIDFDWV